MNRLSTLLVVLLVILLASSLKTSVLAATYHLDAVAGDDAFDGASPAPKDARQGPWKTLERLNGMTLAPGDVVLFKAGQTFAGGLRIKDSGQESNPITFAAYGTGAMPVLSARGAVPEALVEDNWTSFRPNTWTMLSPGERSRLWLDGVERPKAETVEKLSPQTPWFHNKERKTLYIHATDNPAKTLSSIEMPYVPGRDDFSLRCVDADWLVFRQLDLRGGNFASVGLAGSDNLRFEDCAIGLDTNHYGLVGNIGWLEAKDPDSNNVHITRCIIDSGLRFAYEFTPMEGADGVSIRNGASFWEVSESTFRDWYHNALEILAETTAAPASSNKIFRNRFFAEHISYGRAFSTAGATLGACTGNEFFQNVVAKTSVRNQIGGDGNLVHYNVILGTTNIRLRDHTYTYGGAQGFTLETMFGGKGVSQGNKIFNNVIYQTDEAGVWVQGYGTEQAPGLVKDNEISNNIIFACGLRSFMKDSTFGLIVDDLPSVGPNTFRNNLIYAPDVKKVVLFNETPSTVELFNATQGKIKNSISGNRQAPPQFLNPAVDFALAPNSPCIDAGLNLGLKHDYRGVALPQGAAPDIGAYEFQR